MTEKEKAQQIRDIEPEPREDPEVDPALEPLEYEGLVGESEHAVAVAGKQRDLPDPDLEEEAARENEPGMPVEAELERLGRRFIHGATQDR